MSAADRAFGLLLLLSSTAVFLYYTAWALVLPFVDEQHFMHDYFLPRRFAVSIPLSAALLVFSLIGAFLALVLIRSKAR
jgi:dolichol phosphate-mannose biosynthesis regulatory protein